MTKDVPDYALVVGNPGADRRLDVRVRRQAGAGRDAAGRGALRDRAARRTRTVDGQLMRVADPVEAGSNLQKEQS